MAGNSKKGGSKIPVLRELCTNIRKSDQLVVTGKRSRFLSFLSRVGGDKSVGQSGEKGSLQRESKREDDHLQEKSEGEAVQLSQKLESCQKENEFLKSKISKYEKLCSSLDHAFDDHGPSQKKEEEEDEALLNLFVENVILRANQTLLFPELQAVPPTLLMESASTPTVAPPVCTQSTQTSVSTAPSVCIQYTQTSVPTAPPVCTHSTQTSVSMVPPVCTQCTQTSVPTAPPVCTQSTQTSVSMAPPVCTQSTQTSVPTAPPVCTQSTQTSVSTAPPVCTQCTQTSVSMVPPVCTQCTQTSVPTAPPVCTQSTQTSVSMAPPVCTQYTQTSVPMAPPVFTQSTQTSIPVMDTSVNTSLVERDLSSDRTQPVDVSTSTSFLVCDLMETQDAETNTSVLAEPSCGAEVGEKKLEVALATRALLQSSVEDLQTHVGYLESANASLRDELKGKDVRLATMGNQLLNMISKYEATDDKEQTRYKDLYHRSVQHCEILQSQVQRFGALFAKLQKINTLKEVVLSSVAQNFELVEDRYREWCREKQECNDKLQTVSLKHAQLQEEYEAVRRTSEAQQADHGALLAAHAQLLARHCIVRAVQTLEREEHQRAEKSVSEKEAENGKLKKALCKLSTALQRTRQEQQETLEFSEAERETLLEANTELETKLGAVQGQLGERDLALCTLREQLKAAEESVSELKEERSNARDLIIATSQEAGLLRSAVKEACSLLCSLTRDTRELLPQDKTEEGSLSVDPTHLDGLESKELIGYFEGYMEETRVRMGSMKSSRKKKEEEEKCKCCQRMREELESTHKMLNENGARQYGTLLREKISLQEQVRELTAELSEGSREYEKLTSYVQQYQANATQKISVLKDNLSKADAEVHELDKIVDQVREVLHSNISHVKQSKPLLMLLAELDGDEAPNQY